MANFDGNVVINVTGDAPAVPSRSFGTIMLIAAATTLGAGFTERYREYTTAAGVAADLAATDISAATAAKLNAWLAQSPRVAKVMVGRADIEAQVTTITISTAADGVWTVAFTTPGGVEIEADYTASGSALASAIATGLRASITSELGSGSGVTVGGSGADITLTAAAGDDAFTLPVVTEPGSGIAGVVATNAAVSLKTELDAILADTTAFYCVCQEATSHLLNYRLSQWVNTNARLGLLQTSDSVLITSGTTDIAYVLKAALDARNAVVYHATAGNAESPAFLAACKKLQANPDRASTAWAYVQLSGPTVQVLSDTAKGHLLTKNANVYGSFGGAGSFQPGKTADGGWLDKRIAFDWLQARCREGVQQKLINDSNANRKNGMDDAGIQGFAAVIAGVLKQGEAAGHFTVGSTSVTAPAAADLTSAEKQSGALTLTATGELRTGIYSVTTNITLVVDLASLSDAA